MTFPLSAFESAQREDHGVPGQYGEAISASETGTSWPALSSKVLYLGSERPSLHLSPLHSLIPSSIKISSLPTIDLMLNWKIHAHPPSRKSHPLLVAHINVGIIPLQQCCIHPLCLDVLDILFCLLRFCEALIWRGRRGWLGESTTDTGPKGRW